MTYSFNLIDKPWIPCLTSAGEREEFGIRQVLAQAHELREIRGDTPLETVALYRLLLTVLHRVFGPENSSSWRKLWQKREQGLDVSDIDRYLKCWRHKFDLFDPEHPFFQVANEAQLGERSTVNKMIPRLTPDATLFEHTLNSEEHGARLTAAEAARALITNQNYGLGYNQFVDAPCAKGTVFMIQGSTLIETLLLNLVRYPVDSGVYASTGDDSPAWEQDDVFNIVIDGKHISRDFIIDDKRKRVYKDFHPLGQLDYLTWHNRKTKLFPEGPEDNIVVRTIAWAPGMRLDKEVLDPMQHYTKSDQEGWDAYVFKPERAIWRDLDTLLRFSRSNSKSQGIASITWIARLAMSEPQLMEKTYCLSAFGTAKKAAKLLYLRHETTPLPIDLLQEEELLGQLTLAMQVADDTAFHIGRAAFVLAWLTLYPTTKSEDFATSDKINVKIKAGSSEKSKDEQAKRIYNLFTSWGIERYYWSDLGVHFHSLLENLPNAPELALQTWRDQVRHTATAAFQQAEKCAGKDNRAMRAAAVARQHFYIGLAATVGKASTNHSIEGGEEL